MLPGRKPEPELLGHKLDRFVEPFVVGVTETPGNVKIAQRLMHPAMSSLVETGVQIGNILEPLAGGALINKPKKQRDILLKTAQQLGRQMSEGRLILGEGVSYYPESTNTVGSVRSAKRRDRGIECDIGDEGLADYFRLALKTSLRRYKLAASHLRKYTTSKRDRTNFIIYIDSYLKDPEFRRLLNIAIATNLDFRQWQKSAGVLEEGGAPVLQKDEASRAEALSAGVKLSIYCCKNPTEQVDLTRLEVFKTAWALG